jgi:hypothetical protein
MIQKLVFIYTDSTGTVRNRGQKNLLVSAVINDITIITTTITISGIRPIETYETEFFHAFVSFPFCLLF